MLGKDDFWTGGKYWPQRQFKWNDANEIEFVNWAHGEPAKGNLTLPNNVHFILLKAAADFKWTNEWFKYDRNYFICKEIVQANTDPLPPSTFIFTGKRYHFNTTFKMSAFAGFSYCYDKRMTLLSIVSKEEDNWIVSKIKQLGCGSDDFWTGGVFNQFNGAFGWNAINDKVTFTNWADDQPRKVDVRFAHCAVLEASTEFKWSIRLCQLNYNYVICKEKFP